MKIIFFFLIIKNIFLIINNIIQYDIKNNDKHLVKIIKFFFQ